MVKHLKIVIIDHLSNGMIYDWTTEMNITNGGKIQSISQFCIMNKCSKKLKKILGV